MKLDISEKEQKAIVAALSEYCRDLRDGAVDRIGRFVIDLDFVTDLTQKMENLKEQKLEG